MAVRDATAARVPGSVAEMAAADLKRPYAEVHEDGTATIYLKRPIVAHGDKVEKLTMKPATGATLIDAQIAAKDQLAEVPGRMLAELLGIPYSSVRTLCKRDFEACFETMEQLDDF